MPRFGHYLGAYLIDGMHDTVLTDVALELHRAMPRVMKDHHLKEMWSYKYESSSRDEEKRTGIHVHADDGELIHTLLVWFSCICRFLLAISYFHISITFSAAMVNVNLWITPDEANLDPSSGGLVM